MNHIFKLFNNLIFFYIILQLLYNIILLFDI
jgi:hypothetical protein